MALEKGAVVSKLKSLWEQLGPEETHILRYSLICSAWRGWSLQMMMLGRSVFSLRLGGRDADHTYDCTTSLRIGATIVFCRVIWLAHLKTPWSGWSLAVWSHAGPKILVTLMALKPVTLQSPFQIQSTNLIHGGWVILHFQVLIDSLANVLFCSDIKRWTHGPVKWHWKDL